MKKQMKMGKEQLSLDQAQEKQEQLSLDQA